MSYDKACIDGNCLKKFLVNFRRGSHYKGEYGFDWVREDYIYKNLKLNESNNTNNPFESVGGVQQNGSVEICNEVELLKSKYLKYPNVIKPYGYEYFASWCSLFSSDVSSLNKKGINLSLQIEEIEKLIPDGTILELIPTSQKIKITPDKISISKILSGKKVTINKGRIKSNSYLVTNVINLQCLNKISKVEQVRVFAKRNGTSVEVGKLNIYPNNVVKKTKINVVPVSFDNGTDTPKIVNNLTNILKNNCFNQAIIDVDVKIQPVMDIKKILNNLPKNNILGASIISQYNYLWLSKNTISAEMYLSFFSHFYSSFVDKKANIDKKKSLNNTYVFVTTRTPAADPGLYGIASHEETEKKIHWGDACVIFNKKNEVPFNYIHEIAHTFGLEHSFQNVKYDKTKLTFRQGYTDNSIDYTWIPSQTIKPRRNQLSMLNNGCFFFWQWDTMRSDRSMK